MPTLGGWTYLALAALMEMVFVAILPASDGFRRAGPTALVIGAGLASLFLLSRAMQDLPVSLAYPVWVGGGVLAAALYGIAVSGEAVALQRLFFLALLVVALAGLKYTEA